MNVNSKNLNNDLENLSDADLARLWRSEKKDLQQALNELKEKAKEPDLTKNARRRIKKKIKAVNKRIEMLKAATSRHMKELGKMGGAKMARRAKQKRRREDEVKSKTEHEAKIAARKARRAKEAKERKERDEARKAELETRRKEQDSKRLAKLERKAGYQFSLMSRATA